MRSRWERGLGGAGLCCGLFLAWAATAHAHPLVDQARAEYDSGDMDGAMAALDRAEEASDLGREDLADALLLRANVHRRQRDMDLAEAALTRLASLDPTRELGARVHPSLRRLYEQVLERVTAPVRVEAQARRQGDSVQVTATVTDDVGALVQGFRLHARASGGVWTDSTDSTLVVAALTSQAVEYWAEAVGPGGAQVASHGSADAPLSLAADGADVVATNDVVTVSNGTGDGTRGPTDTGGGGGDEIAVILGIVAAVVVVGVGVTLGVYFGTQPTDDTQISDVSVGLTVASFD